MNFSDYICKVCCEQFELLALQGYIKAALFYNIIIKGDYYHVQSWLGRFAGQRS
jgi:hypothetical protein